MTDTIKTPSDSKNNHLVVVGIGASAGGLEALRALVPTLPAHERLAYVIVQHMDPKHSSMLGRILERDTAMKVVEVQQRQQLETGVLYIVPPGMDACMEENKIILEPTTGVGPKPSINRFFISLSKHQGERAIGIILSGTGADGAHGMRAIKEEGGITIAQEEATAKFSSMPHAAIDTGHVDLILTPEKIGETLPDLTLYPRVMPVVGEGELPEDNLSKILRLILNLTGGDFREYKKSTVRRRLERRMAVNKLHQINDYVELLEKTPEEVQALHKDMLISVTGFFRDETAFKALSAVIADSIENSGNKEDIRIWVAGCATGEEAYSVAIMLCEYLGNRVNQFNIQIFASDMDDEALRVARQAIYPKAALAGVDKALLDNYFNRQGDNYQVTQFVRDKVLFAHHDLVKDPPFSHLDLITCRNVIIYFESDLQKRVLQSFHYALEPQGILFLGKSETTGAKERLFRVLDKRHRIYQRNMDVKANLPHLTPLRNAHDGDYRYVQVENKKTSSQDTLRRFLVDVYQPCGVLLDEQLDVSYFHGDVSPFIAFSEGRAVLNIMDLIHSELRHDLRGLLYRARREKTVIRSRAFKLYDKQQTRKNIVLAARYFGETSGSTDRYLLLFETKTLEKELEFDEDEISPSELPRIKSLEEELRESRESLQTTIEELETANEELQSTYEEAQSTNEELFTSTEELQTSNEELQSTNEELRTVNEELSVKSNELEAANEKLTSLNQKLEKEIVERTRTEALLAVQERQLRTIVETEPAWVNICDAEGKILQVNPAGLELMEAESEESLIGKRLEDFAADEHKDFLRECRLSAHSGKRRKIEAEVFSLKNNRRWIEVSTVVLPNLEPEDQYRTMSIICDQTERKKAQDQAMQRQVELAQIMRLNTLGEMASGLAHELNQPLAAITNYIGGCARRMEKGVCEKNDIIEVLRVTAEQAQSAGKIVNGITSFIRSNDFEYTVLDINENIENAITLVRATGEYNNVKFTLRLGIGLQKVVASSVQVEQVLINLIRNALEAMQANATPEPEIIILSKQKKHSVYISVEDNGGGLSELTDRDIFKPFVTTKKNGLGMGMGLSISRSIIEAHGFKLEGANRSEGGAKFFFQLPLASEGISLADDEVQ